MGMRWGVVFNLCAVVVAAGCVAYFDVLVTIHGCDTVRSDSCAHWISGTYSI